MTGCLVYFHKSLHFIQSSASHDLKSYTAMVGPINRTRAACHARGLVELYYLQGGAQAPSQVTQGSHSAGQLTTVGTVHTVLYLR